MPRPLLLLAALMALGAIGAAVLLRSGTAPPVEAPPAPVVLVPVPLPATPVPAPTAIALASEAEIFANRSAELVIRRLASNPEVLVLDFPTLGEQARMLNRIAALVEKAGLPRDRVLDDAALDVAVRAGGGTAETFYYGHNYRAADLARFFTLADRDGVRLTAEEERLRALLSDLGWLRLDAGGALVSVPQEGVEPWLDARARAAMLRHELSHGEFFTNPAYAALVWRFWRDMLTEEERQRFRTVLTTASYDAAQEEVMANEAHAFLFHTGDDRFFSPAMAGLSPERAAAIRDSFVAAMPPGWLRDAMTR
ncbi:MAG TPA: hypothetical protein VGN83_05780 [Falsiroseomonas sp.]|nr:hypothetical protein [Falsiroseomonas sp.]